MGTFRDRDLDLELEDPPEAGTPEPARTPSPVRRAAEAPPPPVVEVDGPPPVEAAPDDAPPPGEGFQWVVEDRRPAAPVDEEEDAPTYGFSQDSTPERARHTSTPPSVSRTRHTPDGPVSVPPPPPPPMPVLPPRPPPLARDERPVPTREALRTSVERRPVEPKRSIGRLLVRLGVALAVVSVGCTGLVGVTAAGMWYATRPAPPPAVEVAPSEPPPPEEFDGIRVEKGLRRSPSQMPNPRTPPP